MFNCIWQKFINFCVCVRNASRTAEMAELLTILGQLQLRFAPFLERYQTFMQEDRTVPEEVKNNVFRINKNSPKELKHCFSLNNQQIKVLKNCSDCLSCKNAIKL